jgi:hypothetical protein
VRFKAAIKSAAVVEDPAAACPHTQWIWVLSNASAMAKLLRLAFPPSRRAKAPLRRDGGRHSRAPFGDATAGLDRTPHLGQFAKTLKPAVAVGRFVC